MQRTLKTVLATPRPHMVGDGLHVIPVLNDKAFTKEPSPFLMFDYAAPRKFEPTTRKLGVGKHPHRGFETVTVAFQGEVEHADSVGNHGVIREGDVQWMTAARGIVHEEYHSRDFAQRGGVLEMAQLWVNLPAAHKMSPPRYQGIVAADIPNVPLGGEGDGFVRVIAGSFRGVSGPAKTFSPVILWDVRIGNPGKSFDLELPESHNVTVFVRRGQLAIGDRKDKPVGPLAVAILNKGGSVLKIEALEKDTAILILAGEPIDEPIAARGPFVMNTQRELQQAFEDYQSGRFGK